MSDRLRPVTTVLDVLRTEIDHAAFDAVLFALETVAADLGYGDIRSLPGSLAWIEQLHADGNQVGVYAAGDRAAAALELAGIADRLDAVSIDMQSAPDLTPAFAALGSSPDRTIAVVATATDVAAARAAGAYVVIALARGMSSPEELRRAGAQAVVADLQELLRAVT